MNPDVALLLLRAGTGLMLITHGYPKLFVNFKGTKAMMQNEGYKPAAFWALCLGITEFFGGIALAIGAATQIVALLIAIGLAVALYTHKFSWKHGFKEYELALLYFIIAIAFIILGGGIYSIDALIMP